MALADRFVLFGLYNSTGGAGWERNDNWNTHAELSTWSKVEVNDQGRVVKLSLSSTKLTGSIPESLGDLSELRELRLSINGLTGTIPPRLGRLSKLEKLALSSNKLTGPIPDSLGNLRELRELRLHNNGLTGPIPASLGRLRKLKKLELENNRLTGFIPDAVAGLTELMCLDIRSNNLCGPIPMALGSLRKLEKLDLENNKLTGLIPDVLGDLAELRTLDLRVNNLRGPVPDNLRKHPRFDDFETGFAMGGPPLPPVNSKSHAIKILIFPVALGYADLASDILTATSYYNARHPIWFVLGLAFALVPAVIMAAFFLPKIEWHRRFLVATQLSLLFEAFKTAGDWCMGYSPVLALVRVVEPLFESVPQLLLQLYAMLRLWTETSLYLRRLVWRVVSVCISTASLAYAATDVSSVEKLLHKKTGGDEDTSERFRLCPCCPSLTGLVFSRVPEEGSPSLMNGLGEVHPRSHVWFCFVYHVLEIVCRFVSLAMLLLVIRKFFFLLLPYLWVSRGLIVWTAAWISADLEKLSAARKALDFRFRLRLVAMPFLDSIVDGTVAFKIAFALTLAEFVLCLAIYHVYKQDDLTASARLTLNVLAISCMVGKMCLAWVAILPLKGDGYGSSGRDGRGGAVADEPSAGSAKRTIFGGSFRNSGVPAPREVEGPMRWAPHRG